MKQAMASEARGPSQALAKFALRVRKKSGLGTREQADLVGLTTSVWSRIERGKGCSVPVLILLYKHTGRSINSMLGLKRPKKRTG